MSRPTPRGLWRYVQRRLRLATYLRAPGDGRVRPQIPARALLWTQLVGQILREWSFHALEALVRSPARRALGVRQPFGDDALAYFTERLNPEPTRRALAATVRQAKRNKAFAAQGFIGVALDGTGAGRTGTVPSAMGCAMHRGRSQATGTIWSCSAWWGRG